MTVKRSAESENSELSPEEYEQYKHCMEEQEKISQEIRKQSSLESAANLEILLALIRDNPELPVIPMVHQEICDAIDYACDFTACKFGKPYIQEYCYYAMGDLIETMMYTGKEKKKVNKDAAKKHIIVEWKEAIFVSVFGYEE